MCGRQHQERLFLPGSHPGHITGMISRLHRFFESGILFSIDPD
jgi:hypothetical protein